ncbi:MAG: hypothetical protein ACRYG7_26180 [Janthinobacterium lividum]
MARQKIAPHPGKVTADPTRREPGQPNQYTGATLGTRNLPFFAAR